MDFTQDEFDYLQALADQGLQDQADAETRNQQILVDQAVQTARDAEMATLQAQAQDLIDFGMADFEANQVPTITATAEASLASPAQPEPAVEAPSGI